MSSPPESAKGGCADEVEVRRRRMIERLQARHATQPSADGADASTESNTSSQSQLDELRARVNELVGSPDARVESGVLQELEDALAILPPGLQSRRFREAYNDLKARLQQQLSGTNKKKAFSFSSKQSKPKPSNSTSSQKCNIDVASSGDGGQKPDAGQTLTERAITVQNGEHESLTLEGEDGREVVISAMRDCRVVVPFSASAVHLKDVHDCTVVLAPVQTSIVVHGCSALTVVAAAQQIRIHSSHRLNLHVAVRGAVILEDCDGAVLHPYRVHGVQLDWHNDNWMKVQDFNWLSSEQSPHWRVAPEQEWCTFSMQSCKPVLAAHGEGDTCTVTD